MARKIMDQLFPPSIEKPQKFVVSLKSWTALLTRLHRLEAHLREQRQKTEKLYQLIRPSLKEEKANFSLQHEKALFSRHQRSSKETKTLSDQLEEWQAENRLIQKALYENEQKLHQLLKQIKDREPDPIDLLPENPSPISPIF